VFREISKPEMGQVTDRAIFLDTPVSFHTWTIVSCGNNQAGLHSESSGSAGEDLPPFYIAGTLHEISQGLVTEIKCSHGLKVEEDDEGERE
jgi:hypothetical protein